jgi:hypothetical protein
MLYPTTVDVLAVHDRLTLCWTAPVPVPLTACASEAFVALLVNEMLPEVAPLVVGAKVTVKPALWPVPRLRGSVRPLSANSALLDAADEIVTPDPDAVNVPLWLWFAPTFTLPKFTLAGDTLSVPGLLPVPDSAMLKFGTDPLALNAKFPLAAVLDWGVNVMLNVRLCPPFKVVGTLRPLVANPVPVTVALEMVMLDPPEFEITSDFVWVLPIDTPVKVTLVGLATRAPTVVPVPERGMLSVGFEALLVIDTFPESLAAAPGVNVTVKLALCPGCIVSEGVRPVMLKPAPVNVAAEMTAAAVPPFVRLTVCDCGVPTCTLPKFTLAGFADNDPEAKPNPASVIVAAGIVPENPMLPLALPADCGANVTVKPAVCPDASVIGRFKPLRLNPAPVATAWDTVMLAPPLFVKLAGWLCFVPIATLPKFKVAGLAVKAPGVVPVPVTPAVRTPSEALESTVRVPDAAPDLVGEKATLRVVFRPAASVIGNTGVLRLKPGPVTAAAVMVALVPLELLIETVRLWLVPTFTEPNATLAGIKVNCPAVVPAPETVTDAVVGVEGSPDEPAAAPVMSDAWPCIETLPDTCPADFGTNTTLNDVLCPGARVIGSVNPVNVKAALLADACATVTLDSPELVKVAVFARLCPTRTLPNVTVAGFTTSLPASIALPDTAKFVAPFVPPAKATLADGLPTALGVNESIRFTLCLGLSVIGNAGETTLNSGSDTVTPEIMTKAEVLFVSGSVMVLLLPTTTVPKLRLALPRERAPFGLELPPESPWQPVIAMIEKTRRVTAIRSQRELRSMSAPLSAALAFVRRESFNFRYCQLARNGQLETNDEESRVIVAEEDQHSLDTRRAMWTWSKVQHVVRFEHNCWKSQHSLPCLLLPGGSKRHSCLELSHLIQWRDNPERVLDWAAPKLGTVKEPAIPCRAAHDCNRARPTERKDARHYTPG